MNPSRSPLRPVVLLTLCAAASSSSDRIVAADGPPDSVREALESRCGDCHAHGAAEGGFELSALPDAPTLADAGRWDRVHDRIAAGEMPPADYDELSGADRRAIADGVHRWLSAQQAREAEELGRSRGRRLTVRQLERSLHAVLGIDTPLAHLLPPARRHHGYTTVTEGGLSHHDLAGHLRVVDAALDEAFRRALTADDTFTRELSAEDLCRRNPKKRTREPELFRGMAVVWQAKLPFYGRLPRTEDEGGGGWYRFTFEVESLKAPPEGLWCTVRTGAMTSSSPILQDVAVFLATPEAKTITVEAWLPEGHMFEVRPHDERLKQGASPGGQVGAGEMQPQNVAGLGIRNATLTKFHAGPDDDGVRALLFGDMDKKWVKNPKRGRREPAGRFEMRPRNERGAIASLMRAFADRAFRRPVDTASLAPYVDAAQAQLDARQPFAEALRAGYRSLLCSPRFLYHIEEPGELDGPSLASRLSYFLTGGPPDEALAAAGASGAILEDDVLKAQTDRLLSGGGLDRFVVDFAREWLDLSELDATEVIPLYPNFDPALKISMRDQTHALLRLMLEEDLSVTHVVDADFALLNERLADHYDLPHDAEPAAWSQEDPLTRVALPPGSPRGGLLTQGAILKLTADGANTSPVLRGVWASERLLGVTVPPPPEGIPAVEPDTRGATTIREQLAKHRADPSCASCHDKVDPVGFALESFDPGGAFRTDYTRWKKRKIVPRAKIDPSYTLADGETFEDVAEFQELAASRPDDLAANLARQLLTYGAGAPIAFADRPAISDVVRQARSADYGVRSLLHECVRSPLFRRK